MESDRRKIFERNARLEERLGVCEQEKQRLKEQLQRTLNDLQRQKASDSACRSNQEALLRQKERELHLLQQTSEASIAQLQTECKELFLNQENSAKLVDSLHEQIRMLHEELEVSKTSHSQQLATASTALQESEILGRSLLDQSSQLYDLQVTNRRLQAKIDLLQASLQSNAVLEEKIHSLQLRQGLLVEGERQRAALEVENAALRRELEVLRASGKNDSPKEFMAPMLENVRLEEQLGQLKAELAQVKHERDLLKNSI